MAEIVGIVSGAITLADAKVSENGPKKDSKGRLMALFILSRA
jgi:hypothetical protein